MKPGFDINGNRIAWPFFFRVLKKCKGNHQEAWAVFYRSRDKEKIIPYISKGIKDGWIWKRSVDEEDKGTQKVEWWVENVVFGNWKPKTAPATSRKPVEPQETGQTIASEADYKLLVAEVLQKLKGREGQEKGI